MYILFPPNGKKSTQMGKKIPFLPISSVKLLLRNWINLVDTVGGGG